MYFDENDYDSSEDNEYNEFTANIIAEFNYDKKIEIVSHYKEILSKEPEFIGEIIERGEEKVLLEKAELSKAKWLKLAIILGIDCGIRRGEILKIHRSDIDFNKSTVVLKDTKNGSSRKVGLSKRAIEEIKKLPININGKLINCLRLDP